MTNALVIVELILRLAVTVGELIENALLLRDGLTEDEKAELDAKLAKAKARLDQAIGAA